MKHNNDWLKEPETHFFDLDGTLIYHYGCGVQGQITEDPILLPGTLKFLTDLRAVGSRIIITTGRPSTCRSETIDQLNKLGLPWDDLIMGLSRGRRVLWNDHKPNSAEPTCLAYSLPRNSGVYHIHETMNEFIEVSDTYPLIESVHSDKLMRPNTYYDNS